MFDLMHYSESEKKEIIASMVVLIDTREHEGKNDHILDYLKSKKVDFKIKSLPYGDYSFMIPANEKLNIPRPLYFDKKIMVERKNSLDELCGNLAKERSRLKEEFTLGPKQKVLLIENASYEDVISGKYRSNYSPTSLWGTLHKFWHEYNMPVFFIKDKSYTAKFLLGYFGYYIKMMID